MHLVQNRVGHLALRRALDVTLAAVAGEDHNLILLRVKADVGAGDVVDHDRVKALALELLPAISDSSLAVLGRKSDDQLAVMTLGRKFGENVLGRLERDLRR